MTIFFIMYDSEKIKELIEEFGWEETDDIVVEVGGTAVRGIHQTEGANAKWAAPFGTVKRQKDAFIIIKNKSRNPVISSQTPEKSDG